MQDEYGRPLSDDGKWVWDGSAWQPRGGAGPGQAPGTSGYEPTMLAPRDYEQSGGQPGSGAGQGYPQGGPQGQPGTGGYGPQGPYGPPGPYGRPGGYGPQGTYSGGPGGIPPRTPWWKRPVVFIGALLVLSAVLVTVILLTRSDSSDNGTNPTPSPTLAPTTEPTSEAPTETPTSEAPTETPTQTPSAAATVNPGLYDCTQDGQAIGTVSFGATSYTTSTGSVGTYTLDESTGDISFDGGDLSPYVGTYDASGPSMDLSAADGTQLHCAQ